MINRLKSTNRLFILGAFALVIGFIYSCGTDPIEDLVEANQTDGEEYYEFQGFDLSPYEIPALIMLPDETANIGASTKPEVIHTEGNFYWDINVGQNFQLHVEDYGDNKDLVKTHKKALAEKDMFQITYLVDDPELVVYERKLIVKGVDKAPKTVGVEHVSYHVYGQKQVNNIMYEFRSRDEGYTQMIIELMAKSIRSVESIQNS